MTNFRIESRTQFMDKYTYWILQASTFQYTSPDTRKMIHIKPGYLSSLEIHTCVEWGRGENGKAE